MKSACIFLCLLALGAATLAAQNANRSYGVIGQGPGTGQQAAANKAVADAVRVDLGCPVSMRAQHLADGEMVKTGKARPEGLGQWLHLTFMAPDSRRIAKATLAIYGSSPKGRVTKTASGRSDSSDASTALTAEFTAGTGRNDVADLWVPGMTAVQSIEVLSVVLGDGSTLKFAGDLTCRVAPDLFMPIANR